MFKLKKLNIDGHLHFVSTNVSQRRKIFLEEERCQALIDNIRFYRNKYKFKLVGYVIMPDHIHLLIWLPNRSSISRVIGSLKSYVAKQLKATGGTLADTKGRVWQQSFYDFNVYSDAKFNEKLNYMHYNPVDRALVEKPAEYPWSSYRNYFPCGKEPVILIDRIDI